MPQYMTVHRAPGLNPDELAANALNVFNCEPATFRQFYVNLGAGVIVSIYEAENQDDLEEAFEQLGFPHGEIHEVQFAQSRQEMEGMLKSMGKL
ncbi:MAG: DUF4242 domain-containing protein [Alphaproteobacteria bacterium]